MKTTLFSKNRNEKNYELFFESDELHRVQYLLETKQFGELSELQSSEDEDTGIKLKLSLAERGKLVTAQLFEYIMSAYEAAAVTAGSGTCWKFSVTAMSASTTTPITTVPSGCMRAAVCPVPQGEMIHYIRCW